MVWTDAKIGDLSKLWEEGFTTAEIGRKLGVTKNAVVGKAHRLNLESRASPIKRKKNAEKSPNKTPDKTPDKIKKNITLMDLTYKMCRWPIGDPKDEDFHFCGKELSKVGTYCLEHFFMAYVAPNNLKKNAFTKKTIKTIEEPENDREDL